MSVEDEVAWAELGDRLAPLRLRDAEAVEAMGRSLREYGQLTALAVFREGGALQVLDGFKRLYAARSIGLAKLRVTIQDLTSVDAKVRIAVLHERRGLTEIEEAWVVRSLYRENHLSQGDIARRLGRHKSWVCRRLMLVETLDASVQADVRLGMLAPRTAVAIAALPRGNQSAVSAIVIRRGLTVRQTELLVAKVVALSGSSEREALLSRLLEGEPMTSARPPLLKVRNEADWMAGDIATVLRVGARLEARLLDRPLDALGGPADIIFESLLALAPALDTLRVTIARVLGRERVA